MIDLFDVGLFHAPLTAGVRLSGFDGIFDSGGKSAGCKGAVGKCCAFCRGPFLLGELREFWC
jgi:hypothetical protein